MTIDKEELVKLPPKERIKKLKLLEEERKKEFDEIGRLIKESMQEVKTDKLAGEIAPEQRAVDISRLFETTGEQRLERTVREEAHPSALMRGAGEYQAFVQTYQDYTNLKKIMGYAAAGSLSEEQLPIIDAIGERLDRTKYEPVSAELAGVLVASINTLKKIRKYMGI